MGRISGGAECGSGAGSDGRKRCLETEPEEEYGMQEIESESEKAEIPEFVHNPQMEMPEKVIDGQIYIGVVEIPTLSLKLPVIRDWSDERLKIAPCRYVGSIYTGDLIISGHSYKNIFAISMETGGRRSGDIYRYGWQPVCVSGIRHRGNCTRWRRADGVRRMGSHLIYLHL